MKKLFKKIAAFLKLLFGGSLNEWIHEHVRPSIEFVQRFKALLNSPVASLLTILIPGDWDEKLRVKMIENLEKALTLLHGVNAFTDAITVEDKIKTAMALMKEMPLAMQHAYLFKLASELSKISGGATTIKGHSVDLLTQTEYSKMKEEEYTREINTEHE